MTPEITLPTKQPSSERPIEWGGVLKGAAIVAGVALAAVVGVAVFSAIGAAAVGAASPSMVTLLGTSIQAIGSALSYGWGFLTGIPTLLVNAFGLTGGGLTFAAAGHSIATALGIAGGTTAAAMAAHGAMAPHTTAAASSTPPDVSGPTPDVPPTPGPTTPGSTSTVAPNMFAAGTGAHTAATVAETAHAAHGAHELNEMQREHTQRQYQNANWSDKFASRAGASHGSHADAVRARSETKPPIQPREASFTAQAAAERAATTDEFAVDR